MSKSIVINQSINNSIDSCLTLCMSTYIGSMFRSELRINSWRWCI